MDTVGGRRHRGAVLAHRNKLLRRGPDPDLTVDSAGKLTGTVLVKASAAPGPHTLKITQGGTTATLVLGVLGTRTLQLSPPEADRARPPP